MIHRTIFTSQATGPTNGIIMHAPQMHIARPIEFPSISSVIGMFLPLNSEVSVFVIPSTTKKCHTILTNSTNNNHSIPGSRLLEATEHLFKAFVSVRTYRIVGSRSRQATNRRTIRCHGCRKSPMNNSLQEVYRRRSNYIAEADG